MSKTLDQLESLVAEGEKATGQIGDAKRRWSIKATGFLSSAFGSDYAREFENITARDLDHQHAYRLGHIKGLIAKLDANILPAPSITQGLSSPMVNTPAVNSRKIFIVHGHDHEAKEGVARFLEKLGLEPIILHEQPSSGRTVIEKFETYSGDIAFAVVLLTPDDVGGSSRENIKPRARQNVILELGYFLGRLGRIRVCALYKGDVELPSDYQGVLYVDLDDSAWKAKLAQELVEAKLPIDLGGLLGG